jgi:hypothetical protein
MHVHRWIFRADFWTASRSFLGWSWRVLLSPERPLAAIGAVSAAGSVQAWGVDRALPGLLGLLLGGLAAASFIYGMLWVVGKRVDFGVSDAVVRAWPRLAELVDRLGAFSRCQAVDGRGKRTTDAQAAATPASRFGSRGAAQGAKMDRVQDTAAGSGRPWR